MKIVGDDLIVPKFCARLNLLTRVHIVKGLIFSTTCASKSLCKIHKIFTTLEHGIGKQY
jgi:hypothetical protein